MTIICAIGFVLNASLLVYELLKAPDPNNPIELLDKIIGMPSLIISTIGLGFCAIYFMLKNNKK